MLHKAGDMTGVAPMEDNDVGRIRGQEVNHLTVNYLAPVDDGESVVSKGDAGGSSSAGANQSSAGSRDEMQD